MTVTGRKSLNVKSDFPGSVAGLCEGKELSGSAVVMFNDNVNPIYLLFGICIKFAVG